MQNVTLEICAGSYDSALAALKGGADRVEGFFVSKNR